jgi:hypothetical protein
MKRTISCLIGACLSFPIQAEPLRLDGKTPEERGAAMVRYVASLKPDPRSETYPKASAPLYAARLVLNVDTEYALAKLDIACTWNQGYNVGSASRAKYWGSTDTGLESMASTASAAWVSFGAPRSIAAGGIGFIHSFWMATPGVYKVPEAIVQVANRRSEPFLHRSYVAGMGKANVHRMTWHTPDYSLCSQWDQPGDPTSGLYKESRRHMLKWVSGKASSTFAVCMENPYRPYALHENRANTLGYGENGFSQYMQHEGTLLGLYAVPEKVKVRNREFEYPYYKLYAPFPATGSIVKRIEKGGWVFCHNGSMLMEFQWQPHKEPYNGHLKVDGKPLVFSQEILHENPMVHQKTGGPLIIEHNGKKLIYDFEKWEKTGSR